MAADRCTPISWLPRAVPVLPDGRGPRIVGVAQETLMGKALLVQLTARAEREEGPRC